MTPWTAARQAPLFSTISWSLLKSMSMESVMPSNHLILCCSFFLWLQSFPASGSFPVSWLLTSVAQSIVASALASVFPMNIQDWFPLGLTVLVAHGTLKSLLQHHNLKASIPWHSAFFVVQLSHLYMTAGKAIALTVWTFVSKRVSPLFNMLFRFVIAFLSRSQCPLIPWLQSQSPAIWEPKKINSVTTSTFLL